MKYDISVVLGSKNRKNLIKATIKSVRQNGFDGTVEIIVIDGGSTDGTCDWLARQNDVLTIIQPNYSVIGRTGHKVKAHSWGEFMNIAFKYTHSDYICMISDDLILAPGCLQKGYDEIKSRIEKSEKLGGGAFYFREYPRHDYFRVITLMNDYKNINHGFYYKPALEDVGWIDETSFNFYYGDTDLAMRLNQAGWKIIDLKECFALHLVHLPQQKKKIPAWFYEDEAAFYKKYPEKAKSSMLKSETAPRIVSIPFWRYALKNVLLGYVLRYIDKKGEK